MNVPSYPTYPTANGYLTEAIKLRYIEFAIAEKLLPKNAFEMPEVLSLTAPADKMKPIQFWQLFSVLGPDNIVGIVSNFYQRVFANEEWFYSVFARIGGVEHHIRAQAGMWADTMGGGPYYAGGEFRLNFHHENNAFQLMNENGAQRWVNLMVEALDASREFIGDDDRVRISLNTFLAYFFSKYASDFEFENKQTFEKPIPFF